MRIGAGSAFCCAPSSEVSSHGRRRLGGSFVDVIGGLLEFGLAGIFVGLLWLALYGREEGVRPPTPREHRARERAARSAAGGTDCGCMCGTAPTALGSATKLVLRLRRKGAS